MHDPTTNPALMAFIVLCVFFFEFSLLTAVFWMNDKSFSPGEKRILAGILIGGFSIAAIFLGVIETAYRWKFIEQGVARFTAAIMARAG
jgi:hypothetical protein